MLPHDTLHSTRYTIRRTEDGERFEGGKKLASLGQPVTYYKVVLSSGRPFFFPLRAVRIFLDAPTNHLMHYPGSTVRSGYVSSALLVHAEAYLGRLRGSLSLAAVFQNNDTG